MSEVVAVTVERRGIFYEVEFGADQIVHTKRGDVIARDIRGDDALRFCCFASGEVRPHDGETPLEREIREVDEAFAAFKRAYVEARTDGASPEESEAVRDRTRNLDPRTQGRGALFGERNYESDLCQTCDGTGEENRCIDDMCSGSDTCIHGDGYVTCRTCGGVGYV